jgi:hypothetical protein
MCIPCGNPADQNAILVMTLIVALSILLVLSVCITILKPVTLAECVHLFCSMQVVALVCVQGVRNIPFGGAALTELATSRNTYSHASACASVHV